MKGVRELKTRLTGVKNIKKITKAMEMVAATKLRRLQERSLATRPYAAKIEEMMRRVASHVDPGFSPLLIAPDAVTEEAIVVVSADRGLCGSYNSNLLRAAGRHVAKLRDEGVTPQLFLFGKKAQAYFRKAAKFDVAHQVTSLVEKVDYAQVKRMMRELTEGYVEGRYHRVRVLYTRMKSLIAFEPVLQDLLPIAGEATEGEVADTDYILEPSPKQLMERLLPRYLEMQLFAAVLESLTSEFASRRMAMKSATDNADEMTDELTMEYNKARQAGITGDLLDIVGGAMAQA